MSDLPVPTGGSPHDSLWPHLLLALHAALPVSERENLVQVSNLLRGRAQRRPQEVRTALGDRREELTGGGCNLGL